MSIQVEITKTEHTGLMILKGTPNDMDFITKLFESLSNRQINIDMISQSPPHGDVAELAFTFEDDDLAEVLKVISELRKNYSSISPSVSGGNVKLLVKGEQMRNQPGIACRVFRALSIAKADIRLITTSEIDISILVPEADHIKSYDAICDAFNH